VPDPDAVLGDGIGAGVIGPKTSTAMGRIRALLVLDASARIRWLNRAAEALVAEPEGLTVEGGRLTACAAGEARRLQSLISQAAAPGYGKPSGGSMSLATPGRRRRLSVLVTPARSERSLFFGAKRSVIVSVSDLEAAASLPQQRLRDLFGLSAAETKFAFAIFRGLSLREAAAELGSSYFTVRAHLVRIYAKTGTSRQSELVAVMARAAGVRLDS